MLDGMAVLAFQTLRPGDFRGVALLGYGGGNHTYYRVCDVYSVGNHHYVMRSVLTEYTGYLGLLAATEDFYNRARLGVNLIDENWRAMDGYHIRMRISNIEGWLYTALHDRDVYSRDEQREAEVEQQTARSEARMMDTDALLSRMGESNSIPTWLEYLREATRRFENEVGTLGEAVDPYLNAEPDRATPLFNVPTGRDRDELVERPRRPEERASRFNAGVWASSPNMSQDEFRVWLDETLDEGLGDGDTTLDTPGVSA